MNTLKDWSCEVTLEKEVELTVGQPFAIVCSGGTPVNTASEILLFPNNEKVQYDVVALQKTFRSENQIFIKATSWKKGSHDLSAYTLVIDDNVVEIKGPKFKVKSLLEAGAEMNLPPGHLVPKLPVYAQAGILVAIMAAFFGVFLWFHLNKKYDRALIKLHALKGSLSPYNELNKQLRYLDVEISKLEDFSASVRYMPAWIQGLEKVLINYLSLTMNEPLFYYAKNKRAKVVAKFLKKKKISLELLSNYNSLAKEMNSLAEAANKSETNSTDLMRDFLSTVSMLREFVDGLQNQLEAKNA